MYLLDQWTTVRIPVNQSTPCITATRVSSDRAIGIITNFHIVIVNIVNIIRLFRLQLFWGTKICIKINICIYSKYVQNI